MKVVCKNCGNEFEGNFCNNCGQKADTQKLNSKVLWNNTRHLIFKYFDKGILFSCGQLYTRPGNTIREYLEGKRVKHFEPFALLVTLAGLYGLLYHTYHINLFSDITVSDTDFKKINFNDVNDWISNHYALSVFIILPVYSFSSFIVFRKQGYNLVEHLTLNTFLASQRLLFRIVSFPLLIIYNGTEQIHAVMNLYLLLDFILIIWSYCQFFNKLSVIRSFLMSVLSYLLFITILILIMTAGLFFWSMMIISNQNV